MMRGGTIPGSFSVKIMRPGTVAPVHYWLGVKLWGLVDTPVWYGWWGNCGARGGCHDIIDGGKITGPGPVPHTILGGKIMGPGHKPVYFCWQR
jgi:hypothetical protein